MMFLVLTRTYPPLTLVGPVAQAPTECFPWGRETGRWLTVDWLVWAKGREIEPSYLL